jgi:hypothetical protein
LARADRGGLEGLVSPLPVKANSHVTKDHDDVIGHAVFNENPTPVHLSSTERGVKRAQFRSCEQHPAICS